MKFCKQESTFGIKDTFAINNGNRSSEKIEAARETLSSLLSEKFIILTLDENSVDVQKAVKLLELLGEDVQVATVDHLSEDGNILRREAQQLAYQQSLEVESKEPADTAGADFVEFPLIFEKRQYVGAYDTGTSRSAPGLVGNFARRAAKFEKGGGGGGVRDSQQHEKGTKDEP